MTEYKPNFVRPGIPANQRTFSKMKMGLNEEGMMAPHVVRTTIPKIPLVDLNNAVKSKVRKRGK